MSDEKQAAPDNEADNPIIPPSATNEYIADSYGGIPNPPTNNGNDSEVPDNNGRSNRKTVTVADYIALCALFISIIVAAFTIRLFYQTADAVKISSDALKISADALEDSREKDSAQKVKDLLTDSTNRAKDSIYNNREIANFDLAKKDFDERSKRDYASLELTKKSFEAQMKSISQQHEEFESQNAPFLQVTGITLSEIIVGKELNLAFELENISGTPVKIISYKRKSQLAPIDFKDVKAPTEMNNTAEIYLVRGASAPLKAQISSKIVSIDTVNLRRTGGFFYYAREIKYRNLVNGKIRFYRFQVKVKPLYGTATVANNTYYEFIYNENEDK
jgi:hypothetical protein